MIRPDFRNFQNSNELYHYGMPRRSGRYPWGSGKRPYQNAERKKSITYSETISKDTFDKMKKIKSSLSEKDKYFVGETMISEYTKYLSVKDGAYLILDNYGGKFKDEHPYNGLIISIAASPESRGTGVTDKLLSEAKEKSKELNDRLIAEIDSDNVNSRKLFERNGFKKMNSFDDLDFYYWDKKLKHSINSESEVKFKMNNFNYYYLSHGGPGSGRYPLGSGERPYQRRGISGYLRARRIKKAMRSQAKAQKSLNKDISKEVKSIEDIEAEKDRVLRSGSATQVLKYQGALTNKELSDAAERLRLERQIKEYSEKEVKTALDHLKKIESYVSVGSSVATSGISLYNSLAAIYNSTSTGKDNPLNFVNRGAQKSDKSKSEKGNK